MTPVLHRHGLVRLSRDGWDTLCAQAGNGPAGACLTHWAAHGLPLVVTRQRAASADAHAIAVGLPAPTRWGRIRLALEVPRDAVVEHAQFPSSERVVPLLGGASRDAMVRLNRALAACGITARAFGSYGWQVLTGLDHVRAGSDLDLWMSVGDAPQADAATSLLHAFAGGPPDAAARVRLDGELVFPDGSAVAWREWAAWRAGAARAVMVKRLEGVTLQDDAGAWAAAQPAVA